MINLNINFYLDENYFYSYLFQYIRTAKCVVIMLRNEFIWFKHAMYCCNLCAKNWQTKLFCWFSATYHFYTRQTEVGKLGNKWGIIPQKLGKCKVEAQIMNEKRDTRQKNTQNMPISLLYLPFFQSENISSGKQEIWLNFVYSYLSGS